MNIGVAQIAVLALLIALFFGRRLGRVGYDLGRVVANWRGLSSKTKASELGSSVAETAQMVNKVRSLLRLRRF